MRIGGGISGRSRVARGLGLCLLGAVLSTASVPAMAAAGGGLLERRGDGRLTLDRTAVLGALRKDLGLRPSSPLLLAGMPASFRGPGGAAVSARLFREGEDAPGSYRYRISLMDGGVARESFYIRVRTGASGTLAQEAGTGGQGAGVGVISRENPATLVHVGDSVRIRAQGAGFLIRFSGIAQSDGGLGDSISVVNPVSGARMEGQVTGPDRIVMRLSGGGL